MLRVIRARTLRVVVDARQVRALQRVVHPVNRGRLRGLFQAGQRVSVWLVRHVRFCAVAHLARIDFAQGLRGHGILEMQLQLWHLVVLQVLQNWVVQLLKGNFDLG